MILIDLNICKETIKKAQESQRKRCNYNYHTQYEDPINRLLNAMEPGTYVHPHKHEDPDKREIFLILTGALAVVLFDDNGKIIEHTILDRERGVFGIEVPPRVWHMAIALKPGTVMYEVKDGPYLPMTDKNFASWAPKEGTEECDTYLKKILSELKIM